MDCCLCFSYTKDSYRDFKKRPSQRASTTKKAQVSPSKESSGESSSDIIDGTGADGPRSEGGKRILLDNSRVYVRFLPFVVCRLRPIHLGDREPD